MILRHVTKDKLPWLKRDRREAEEGLTRQVTNENGERVIEHDRMGLDHARKELRRIQADLAAATTPNRQSILRIMVTQQEAAVRFWEGKMYLLDRVIAALEAQP